MTGIDVISALCDRKVFLAGLLLFRALFICQAPAAAQYGTEASQQTFDYNPPDETVNTANIQAHQVKVEYEDVDIINDPLRGVVILSKHRWKNWVARAVYLLLVDIALILIIMSLPKAEEYNLIISYMLCGSSTILSFWVFLCAVLLYRMHSNSWVFILPLSLAMGVITFIMLMRTKNSDVSLSEVKETFRKIEEASPKDSRLVSVDGVPGDWQDMDIVKRDNI